MGINVGKFSVHNPVLINIVMVAILALGTFSLMRLPREQFSEIPFYWVNITVPYPGVSAEDIEQNITSEIEEQLRGLPDLDQITSTTREGMAMVQVEFEEGISDTRFQQLYQRTQTEFNKVELPEDALEPVISDFSTADFVPVVEVILAGNVPYRVLDRQSELLRDRILDVDGVSDVERIGSREQELHIAVDRQKAEALQISLEEIVSAVRLANATIPAGNLTTTTREYVVRTVGELTEASQFERILVRKLPSGEAISVGELATVRDTFERASVDQRYNGMPAITLRVSKRTAADALEIVAQIREIVQDYRVLLPAGVGLYLFNDSTVQIKDSLRMLITNAITGFVLVVLTLFAFLGFRNAFVTALGIPLTFALTFMFMDFYGESLNGNSLFALVLVLGLIVDHAIIIVENSYRYRQQGIDAEQAAITGTNQVVKPVIAATLTTVAAFLPLMLVPGTIGKFLRIIPLVASFALLSSMLEAFVFLPSHFAHWGAAPKQKRGESFFGRQTKRFAGMIESIYLHKYLIGIVSLLTALAVLSLTAIIRRDLFQGDQYSRFYIDMELAPGAPREKTRDVALEFESKILPLIGKGNVQAVSTAIGLAVKENEFLRQNNVAQLQVDVVERAERQKSIEDIIDDIQALTDTIPGVASVQFRTVQGGPPVDPPVSFRLFGDDYNDLSTIANQFQNLLSDYKGLYNITDDLERGKPELLIRVNNERAEQLGLNVTTIGSHVRTGITGTDATTFYRNNEEIDVVVSYDPEKQKSVQAVTAMHFPTRDPQMPFIPFTSVANTNQDQGIAAIKRVDARRQIQVTAESQPMVDIPAINKDIMKYFEREVREQYPGITLKLGGEFSEFQNILQQIAQLFLIGIFLIYLILGTQFQSYSQPILILFSIPFAFSGVVLYLLLTNTAFSSTVMYAGVALAGIAVNDAIVSISFINDRRKEGRSLMDAIREGASVRLRPIVLTSFTTMAGLLPMAVGIGGRSPVWGPMAATIIFGLIFSTTTTLIIMPCWYGIFEAIKIGRKKKKKGA